MAYTYHLHNANENLLQGGVQVQASPVQVSRFSPTPNLAVFTPKTVIQTLKNYGQGSWVMHIWSIQTYIYLSMDSYFDVKGLKGKNYQYFGSSFNLFKTIKPWNIIKNHFTPHRGSLGTVTLI